MAAGTATILIPDISGFTEFMTSTELSHSSYAINILIDAIVTAVGNEYEVSEIEGDAVLMIRKGAAPSKKEVLDICLKIFNSFHFQRKWLQQYAVCPCGACLGIRDLTLKFVVHHGPLAEIKVGRFVKQSGPEMIVAHRLLKNSIDSHEYLLISEKLLQQVSDSAEPVGMEWTNAFEEYASIGKIDYRFAPLKEARKNVPDPPVPEPYLTDNTPWLEIDIAAGFRDAYMLLMNIPERSSWVPGLQKVEQEIPLVYVGSIHRCIFDEYESIVSPLRMSLREDAIEYAESCRIESENISLIYEFIFTKKGNANCRVALRFLTPGLSPVSATVNAKIIERMQVMAEALKVYFEKAGSISFF